MAVSKPTFQIPVHCDLLIQPIHRNLKRSLRLHKRAYILTQLHTHLVPIPRREVIHRKHDPGLLRTNSQSQQATLFDPAPRPRPSALSAGKYQSPHASSLHTHASHPLSSPARPLPLEFLPHMKVRVAMRAKPHLRRAIPRRHQHEADVQTSANSGAGARSPHRCAQGALDVSGSAVFPDKNDHFQRAEMRSSQM